MRHLLVMLVLAATGCASEHWVDFTTISDAPPSVLLTRDRIEIPAGLAVGVRALPVEDGDREYVTLEMVPVRSGIIGIEQSLEDDEWVIYGQSPGSTAVELFFGDELVGEMPAVVTEQQDAN